MTFLYSALICWLIVNALYAVAMSSRSNPDRAFESGKRARSPRRMFVNGPEAQA